MSNMTLDPHDRMQCPHCGATLEGEAIGAVIPLRPPGPGSRGLDTCTECDEEFTAELLSDGRVKVRMA